MSAWTNKIGYHLKPEERIAHDWWFGRDSPYKYIVNVAWSSKQPPNKYNPGTVKDYSRSWGGITFESSVKVGEAPYGPQEYWISAQIVIPGTYRPFVEQESEENARSAAITKALNGLNDGSLQLGADIGEAGSTARMFGDNISAVAKSLLAAKRGSWGDIPGYLGMSPRDVLSGRFPANRWLEYQYGWKPLFGSIYDTQAKIHRGIEKQNAKLRSTGNGTTSNSINFSDHGYVRDGVKATGVADYSCQCTILAKIVNPDLRNMAQWGLINPASIAWELVPFSFVVDWFVPVGNTLSAMTDTVGLEFERGWTSERFRGRTTIEYKGASMSEEQFSYNRTRLNNFPSPRVYAKENPWSSAHIKNAFALVRSLMR